MYDNSFLYFQILISIQKFVRTKLEQKRYRELFGLTDNIMLVGEEDIVLQREFRIDFVLQKIVATMPLAGIFSQFKLYNLLEFKSYNDRLTTLSLTKYIGQLFWWLYVIMSATMLDKLFAKKLIQLINDTTRSAYSYDV